jgi:ribosome-binding protein aMBF1 (putative translation factor)
MKTENAVQSGNIRLAITVYHGIITKEVIDMQTFGELIKQARKESGISRKQLAKIAKIPYNTIRDIEQGINFGRKETLDKILSALGLDICLVPKDTPNCSKSEAV